MPFLIKTPRYLVSVKSFNSLLFHTFIKSVVNFAQCKTYNLYIAPWVKFIFSYQFAKPFYGFFKKIIFKKYGIYTTNLVKSSLYWTIKNLTSRLFTSIKVLPAESNLLVITPGNSIYSKPIQLISLAFQKKIFNSLMIYIFFLLTNIYTSTLPTFQLNYSFLILPINFQLYMFVNLFYFKVKNY